MLNVYLLSSGVNTEQIKELSTIIEGDSAQSSSYFLSSHLTKQDDSVPRGKLENGANKDSEVWENRDIPDIMTEMLRRGLITSPQAWTKLVQQPEDENSISEISVTHPGDARGSHDAESRNFAASSPQHVEHEEFKQAVLDSYVGKGSGRTTQSFRDCQRIAERKIEFSQQVAETFAKLGKNPSRIDVKNAFKNLGFKWKVHVKDQPVNAVISKDLDPESEEFRQQVLESFVGLGFDSSPEDLEAAFRRLGLNCPGGSLYRSDVHEPKETHSSPDSDTYNPCSSYTCTSIPSYSASSDDDLPT